MGTTDLRRRWTALAAVSFILAATFVYFLSPSPQPGGVAAGVFNPAAIHEDVRSGALTELQANLYHTYALMGLTGNVPARYLSGSDSTVAYWHSAPTLVMERWNELDPDDRARLTGFYKELFGERTAAMEPTGLKGLLARVRESIAVHAASPQCVSAVGGQVQICKDSFVALPGSYRGAGDTMVPQLVGAAETAYDQFAALLGVSGGTVRVQLSDLPMASSGFYNYGFVPVEPAEGGFDCNIYIDVWLEKPGAGEFSVNAVPGTGIPKQTTAEATLVHELFHCFQHFKGVLQAPNWLREGTAAWSEHHIYPSYNTELSLMGEWVSKPDMAFESRFYDSSFAYIYADLLAGGPTNIAALLQSAVSQPPLDALPSLLPTDFPTQWHDISVKGFNQAPPIELLEDNGGTVSGVPSNIERFRVLTSQEDELSVALPPYSHALKIFEFPVPDSSAPPDPEKFSRFSLDLASIDWDQIRITALIKLDDGTWLPPEDLKGKTQKTYCRMRIGLCVDEVTEDEIRRYRSITLVITNVTKELQSTLIPWETYNPRLHGRWRRTSANLGVGTPFQILRTLLEFDEPAAQMTENTSDYSLNGATAEWTCAFAGAYRVPVDPNYLKHAGLEASGVVRFPSVSSGSELAPWANRCTFTAAGGRPPVNASTFHVPVIATPMLEFDFTLSNEGDTLTIAITTGPVVRKYTYARFVSPF